jgi:hypothetical protein
MNSDKLNKMIRLFTDEADRKLKLTRVDRLYVENFLLRFSTKIIEEFLKEYRSDNEKVIRK